MLDAPPLAPRAHRAPVRRKAARAPLEILRTVAEARAFAARHHAAGRSLALVPTMGALHAGHLSLVARARELADVAIMSIYVNPAQFAAGEDLAAYPRDEAGDLAQAAAAGCAAVFLPDTTEMYPHGPSATQVAVPPLQQSLCALSRPSHFPGVALVVCKLFNITGCDVAVFGEKDYQQLAVIRRMVADLNLPVRVVGAPLVREADGLALSSRNVYLSPGERQEALALSQGLFAARAAFAAGERDPGRLQALVAGRLAAAQGAEIDYCLAVDAGDLAPLTGPVQALALLAVAVRFGRTRLIDNLVLDPAEG